MYKLFEKFIATTYDQCCIFRFGTRFDLAIGMEYFGTGPFWCSVSGLPPIYIISNYRQITSNTTNS